MSECGINVQRDLYAAFLAKYVFIDVFDTCQAAETWPGASLLLERAKSRMLQQAAMAGIYPACIGIKSNTTRTRDRAACPLKANQQRSTLATAFPLTKSLLVLPLEPLGFKHRKWSTIYPKLTRWFGKMNIVF
jgi:hypothetical protein